MPFGLIEDQNCEKCNTKYYSHIGHKCPQPKPQESAPKLYYWDMYEGMITGGAEWEDAYVKKEDYEKLKEELEIEKQNYHDVLVERNYAENQEAKLAVKCAELTAERDRLKAALEEIRAYDACAVCLEYGYGTGYKGIADKAIKGGKGE